jgi:hypothetical protein
MLYSSMKMRHVYEVPVHDIDVPDDIYDFNASNECKLRMFMLGLSKFFQVNVKCMQICERLTHANSQPSALRSRKGTSPILMSASRMTVKVRGTPAYDVGTIGKSKVRIGPLKHGMLTRFGYHPVEAKTNRHKALMKAINVGKEDPHAVVRRLVAISTLTKRMAPRASRIYKADSRWVHEKYASRFKN